MQSLSRALGINLAAGGTLLAWGVPANEPEPPKDFRLMGVFLNTKHTSHAPQILVIDDDPAVRRLCEKVLSEDGYHVTGAASGRQALVLTRNNAFDLVVLDLSLGDMDGFRLLEEIRSESPLARVLAVSGFMKSFLLDIATDAGAHAALAKPLSPRNLRKAVYQLIDPTCSWQGEQPDA